MQLWLADSSTFVSGFNWGAAGLRSQPEREKKKPGRRITNIVAAVERERERDGNRWVEFPFAFHGMSFHDKTVIGAEWFQPSPADALHPANLSGTNEKN